MARYIILVIGCLGLLSGIALSQEVVIKDFPLGVGGSVDMDLFKPYYPELQAIADTLHKYPLARAVITGGADGEQYRQNNDAKNPGLALGRAHVLRDLLIDEFKVDPAQIVIQSDDSRLKGGQYRYAGIRIAREMSELASRLDALENRPPVEKHFTEVKEIGGGLEENLGLQLGLGISSSPFGGIPIAAGALSWKRFLYVEGIVGHTFWNNSFQFEENGLDTKRRLIGGNVIFYPSERLPIGIVGGWIRIEEISQEYYEYVKLSEGPVLGLRVIPFDFLSVTGAYNPAKQRSAGENRSRSENDQFLLYVTAHLAFGGAK